MVCAKYFVQDCIQTKHAGNVVVIYSQISYYNAESEEKMEQVTKFRMGTGRKLQNTLLVEEGSVYYTDYKVTTGQGSRICIVPKWQL